MTAAGDRRRGQPLAALAVLASAWIGARVTLWESPFPVATGIVEQIHRLAARHDDTPKPSNEPLRLAEGVPYRSLSRDLPRWAAAELGGISPPPVIAANLENPATMASHQLLWLAAVSQMPVPSEIAGLMRAAGPSRTDDVPRAAPLQSAPFHFVRDTDGRWSGDAWLFYRPHATGMDFAASRPASYGASQAGAVLRYRLGGAADRSPSLYLRATTALASKSERELAAGFSIVPFARVPVSANVEVRASGYRGTTQVRPAAFAVTRFAPLALPHEARAEAYAQAGYVGGAFATPFVDGQVRVDRELARFDLGAVRVGAGAWGGAQKGAARLDLGPSASLDLTVGDTPARVAVDYRVRVAGDAAPGSGIALTLSTGF